MTGKVYLVGAGPGDPELLTVKALRLLKTADAVLYDNLVSPGILKLVSSTAQLHNVGKRCGKKKITQEEINFLLVALAAAGRKVVRLKSGDPLIFGRAGEEIEALRKAGVECEIVPGVTAALGAAATVQIPLTHRRQSSALVLITGHRAGNNREDDGWSKLVSSGATVVIYMPGHRYADIADRLRLAGLAGETPCGIIARATSQEQQVHITTVDRLYQARHLPAPTLLVVGDVVRFAEQEDQDFFSILGALPSKRLPQDEEAIS